MIWIEIERLDWHPPRMVLASINKARQLLHISYIGHVRVGDLTRNLEELKSLLTELPPGFRLLADYSALTSMDTGCAEEVGQFMDLLDQAGVNSVVRIIADPTKDIGMNILTLFHYRNRPRVITCPDLASAVAEISL